jgi:hypothetical protein
MTRALLGLGLLIPIIPVAACTTTDDAPTLSLQIVPNSVGGDEPPSQSLVVEMHRPYGHTWAPLTATINGVDGGPLMMTTRHKYGSQAEVTASFRVPMANIERGVLVEVTEASERFVLEAPDLNAPRAIHLHTPIDVLRADDSIEVDSGVASDELNGAFSVDADGSFCFLEGSTARSPMAIMFTLPPASTFDDCVATPGTTNPPGSTRAVNLNILLQPITPVTRCEGPNLTCDVSAPAVVETMTTTLQF